jgi:hypothetical protein
MRHHDGAVHPRRLPQVRDASALIGSALGGPSETTRSKTPPPVSKSPERVQVVRRLGDLNPGWTSSPNRISSSGRGRSEPSHLGQRVLVISPERYGTAGNCNGNCNGGNALDDARAVDLGFAHAPVARACDTR